MSSEFGIYRVSYTPTSEYDSAYIEPTINMSISGEADLDQMLSFFDSFLKASGYIYDGELKVAPKLKNTISFGSAAPSGISGAACSSTDAVAIGNYNPWEK